MHHYAVLCLFVLFIGKHFLCDFVLQFPYMLEQKGTYGATGGIHHSALHGIFTFAVLAWLIGPFHAALAGIADAVIHYHVDYFKRMVSGHFTVNNKLYWWAFGLDQALHYITYAFIIGFFVA